MPLLKALTMLLSLDQALAHLRADADQVDAQDLQLKITAAELLACEYMGRSVYADQNALDAAVLAETEGESPMVCNDLVRAAMLLILGHLWANREDNVTGTIVTELKIGATQLLAPYRKGMGV